MEYLEGLMRKVSISKEEKFTVGSSHSVDVTFINNPHSFYVRRTSYRSYMPVLHSYETEEPIEDVQVRQVVVYKSHILNSYVRGQVLFIKNEGGKKLCDMYALDFGCIEKSVLLERLHKRTYPIDVPPLAMHCSLADCKPLESTWSVNAIDAMKFFVGDEHAKILVRGEMYGLLYVEMRNTCPDDIATMLALCRYTSIGYNHNASNYVSTPTPRNYFIHKELKIGDVEMVRFQAGDSLKKFYVCLVNDYKIYLNESENVTYFTRRQKEIPPEKIKIGMAVAVLIDAHHKYERAIVTAITVPNCKLIVQMVDWGRCVEVPFARVKPLQEKFFTDPVKAIHCSAEEYQASDTSLHKILYPGFQFKITVKKIGDKFIIPYIVNISLF